MLPTCCRPLAGKIPASTPCTESDRDLQRDRARARTHTIENAIPFQAAATSQVAHLTVDEEFLHPKIKTSRKKKKRKKKRTRWGKKSSKKDRRRDTSLVADGGAMLTLLFVVSPSGVESQNTRASAMKKKEADRTTGWGWRGEWWCGGWALEVEKEK